MGELRQGALEGIVLEAIAKAAGAPLERRCLQSRDRKGAVTDI
jgi:hypothetical protein